MVVAVELLGIQVKQIGPVPVETEAVDKVPMEMLWAVTEQQTPAVAAVALGMD
jgi:hypothetical protein